MQLTSQAQVWGAGQQLRSEGQEPLRLGNDFWLTVAGIKNVTELGCGCGANIQLISHPHLSKELDDRKQFLDSIRNCHTSKNGGICTVS
jgi:hypothetical protein